MENEMNTKLLDRAVVCFKLLSLALVFFTVLAAHHAHADNTGMRCGAQLIVVGFHESQVRALCGEPDSIELYHYDFEEPYGDTRVADWVYNMGPRKLMRLLHFENGRLVRIESLGYGHR